MVKIFGLQARMYHALKQKREGNSTP